MTSRPKKESKRTKGKVKVKDILRRVDRLSVIDFRTADEIVGYDENGLPQSKAQREHRKLGNVDE